jgi:hypothetical protein
VGADSPLGPFAPPSDYQFEPELQGSPPRSIPPKLRQGRYAAGQRRLVWGLVMAGVLCLLGAFVPLIQKWGLYLLPLAWLHWIGAGLLVIAIIAAIVHAVRRGPFRYVEEGMPLVVRIAALELRPTQFFNGQPNSFRYFAVVEYRDPHSGEVKALETSSNEIAAASKDGLICTYRVGDYATAVYLPAQLEKSLRLYGFLDLRPEIGLVKGEGGSSAEGASPVATALLVLGIFGFFFLLCWNVYAFSVYGPVGWSNTLLIPGIAGAVLLGGGLLAYLVWQQRSEKRAREARNAAAAAEGRAVEVEPSVGAVTAGCLGVVVFAGCLLMGGLTAACWALTLNAWLDKSDPRPRDVRIQKMVQVTHNGVFRRYEIKYRFTDEPGDKERDYATTLEELSQFPPPPCNGVARERAGFFGWRWIERITPAGL